MTAADYRRIVLLLAVAAMGLIAGGYMGMAFSRPCGICAMGGV